MNGLLCESLYDSIKESHRDDECKLVRERPTYQLYGESVIPHIAKAVSGVTGTPQDEPRNSWGVCFLGFVGVYVYDRILKVLDHRVYDFSMALATSMNACVSAAQRCQESCATGDTFQTGPGPEGEDGRGETDTRRDIRQISLERYWIFFMCNLQE
ncbi:hypothetical protein Q5P01_009047 [Channa striata]|uniref:Heme NO-binding domain-containing protein n=1 Tax=Channa striata TaxID=64152 RepID=A0AA88SUM1_CHASR|nr:hypothetical protein Q5P01_009047 [Channa striata]